MAARRSGQTAAGQRGSAVGLSLGPTLGLGGHHKSHERCCDFHRCNSCAIERRVAHTSNVSAFLAQARNTICLGDRTRACSELHAADEHAHVDPGNGVLQSYYRPSYRRRKQFQLQKKRGKSLGKSGHRQ